MIVDVDNYANPAEPMRRGGTRQLIRKQNKERTKEEIRGQSYKKLEQWQLRGHEKKKYKKSFLHRMNLYSLGRH